MIDTETVAGRGRRKCPKCSSTDLDDSQSYMGRYICLSCGTSWTTD